MQISKYLVALTSIVITAIGCLVLLSLLTPYYMQTIATTPLSAHPILYAAGLVLLSCATLTYSLFRSRSLSRISIIIVTLFALATIAGTVLFATSSPNLPDNCNSWDEQQDLVINPACHPATPTSHDIYVFLFENYPLAIIIALLAATNIIATLSYRK